MEGSVHERIKAYIEGCRSKGFKDVQIFNHLIKSGYTKEDIKLALYPKPQQVLENKKLRFYRIAIGWCIAILVILSGVLVWALTRKVV